eukprot:snap_masked-scaffold_4-processed-gene-0.38-mRNA-1 protein AED:1.00 eAED:1.00 QI:0/-1/0/0/-1/1/1/0/1049
MKFKYLFVSTFLYCSLTLSDAENLEHGNFPDIPLITVEPIAEMFSISQKNQFGKKAKDKCLTKEEATDIEEIVEISANILSTFSKWTEGAKSELNSRTIGFALDQVIRVLNAEETAIRTYTEPTMDSMCVKCAKVSNVILQAFVKVEEVLDKYAPVWKDFNILVALFDRFEGSIKQVTSICPTSAEEQILFLKHKVFVEKTVRNFGIQKLNGNMDSVRDTFLEYTKPESFKTKVQHFDMRIEPGSMCTSLMKDVDLFCAELLAISEKIPVVRRIPFKRIMNKMVHFLLSEAERLCPNEQLNLGDMEKEECSSLGNEIFRINSMAGMLNEAYTDPEAPNVASIVPNTPLCFSCYQVMVDLDKMLLSVEGFLARKVPMWREMIYFRMAFKFIDEYIRMLVRICPNAEFTAFEQRLHHLANPQDAPDYLKLSHLQANMMPYTPFQASSDCETVVRQYRTALEQVSKDEEFLYYIQLYRNLYQVCPFEFEQSKSTFASVDCLHKKDEDTVLQSLAHFKHAIHKFIPGFVSDAKILSSVVEEVKYFGFSARSRAEVAGHVPDQNICITCQTVVRQVEDEISAMERFLTKLYPQWEEIPFLGEIDNLVHYLLDTIYQHCPTAEIRLGHFQTVTLEKEDTNCLTKGERKEVEEIVKKVDKTFDFLSDQLTLVETALDLDSISTIIELFKSQLRDIKATVDKNIEIAASSLCQNCQDLTRDLGSALVSLEKLLDNSFPSWRDDPVFSVVYNDLVDHVRQLKELCPKKSDLPAPPLKPKEGCLTPDEKEKLYNISEYVETGLSYSAKLIRIYAKFQVDPAKRISLEKTADVVDAIADDIVTNITRLADEFCGTCPQEVDALKDMILVLEDALFDIEPMWKETHIYDAIKSVTDTVFEKLKGFCTEIPEKQELGRNFLRTEPEILFVATSDDPSGCLSPEQEQQFTYYAQKFSEALLYAADALKIYATEVTDEDTKAKYLFVAKVLESVSKDIVEKITRVLDEPCATCADIIQVAKDVEVLVERTMSDVDPNWRSDPEYQRVIMGIEAVLTMAEGLCPK